MGDISALNSDKCHCKLNYLTKEMIYHEYSISLTSQPDKATLDSLSHL